MLVYVGIKLLTPTPTCILSTRPSDEMHPELDPIPGMSIETTKRFPHVNTHVLVNTHHDRPCA
jgi:hypothetical protein